MYNYNYSEDYLIHYGVKGMKWGVRRSGHKAELTKLKQTYVNDAKEASKARKTYVKSMPKVLGLRDAGLADKDAEKAYEKANAKANDSRYNYELAKSKIRGTATNQLVRMTGEKEYHRIYDKLSNTNMSQGKIHERAKAGQLKAEELLRKQKFYLE